MAEGFFRSKKGFTVVQNEITRDVKISLKAKGLYLVIQAYISMPDKKWTKEDFRNLTKEGKKAFDSAWKELKETRSAAWNGHFFPDESPPSRGNRHSRISIKRREISRYFDLYLIQP